MKQLPAFGKKIKYKRSKYGYVVKHLCIWNDVKMSRAVKQAHEIDVRACQISLQEDRTKHVPYRQSHKGSAFFRFRKKL